MTGLAFSFHSFPGQQTCTYLANKVSSVEPQRPSWARKRQKKHTPLTALPCLPHREPNQDLSDMLSHLTFLDLCKSVHFMWPISSFSKLCYWLCPHDNLMSSSVYHQPFSLIPPCYDFQSISTVSYLSALSPLFPVSSFPSTLSK